MLWTLSKDNAAHHSGVPKHRMFHVVSRYWPFLFFLIPGLFYFITACRTPGWVDATLIVSNVVDLELKSWVNCHYKKKVH